MITPVTRPDSNGYRILKCDNGEFTERFSTRSNYILFGKNQPTDKEIRGFYGFDVDIRRKNEKTIYVRVWSYD